MPSNLLHTPEKVALHVALVTRCASFTAWGGGGSLAIDAGLYMTPPSANRNHTPGRGILLCNENGIGIKLSGKGEVESRRGCPQTDR